MRTFNRTLLNSILTILICIFIQNTSFAIVYDFNAPIEGIQEVPPNPSTGLGSINGTYDDVSNVLSFNLAFTGLLSPTTAAHLHAPAPRGFVAPIAIPLVGFPVGVTSGAYANSYVLDSAQEAQILGGLFYVNIHTSASPTGEIRGQLTEGTLPVELSSFTATTNRNNVILNWSTTSEINNSGFDIERKLTSSNDWSKTGNVSGQGNSHEINNYVFTENIPTGVYNYRIKQIDFNGDYEYFNLASEVTIGVATSYSLSQNYPNPFNPTTKIDYELPFDSKVSIVVYDFTGREVTSLVNEFKTAGYYTSNLNGNNLSSGVYFYKLTAQNGNENFVITKRMTLVK